MYLYFYLLQTRGALQAHEGVVDIYVRCCVAFHFDISSCNFKESVAVASDAELLDGLDPTIMPRDVAECLSHEVMSAKYVAWESTTFLR